MDAWDVGCDVDGVSLEGELESRGGVWVVSIRVSTFRAVSGLRRIEVGRLR